MMILTKESPFTKFYTIQQKYLTCFICLKSLPLAQVSKFKVVKECINVIYVRKRYLLLQIWINIKWYIQEKNFLNAKYVKKYFIGLIAFKNSFENKLRWKTLHMWYLKKIILSIYFFTSKHKKSTFTWYIR